MKTEEADEAPKARPETGGEEEEEGEADADAESPVPIDRGWAWMVVVGCFGMHVMVVGGVKSFGVLFVELQQLYDVSARQLGVVHGLASVLMMALGPVSNALSVKYSCRAVVFAGGLLIACGFLSSAFVPSFGWLYFTYSTLTGLGSALAYAPSVVMVGHHFTRRRALANGISVSGSAVGSFILPNLMRHLLNQYGLRGALLIVGAMMLHVCLCAALLRPFSSYRRATSALRKNKPTGNRLPDKENPDENDTDGETDSETRVADNASGLRVEDICQQMLKRKAIAANSLSHKRVETDLTSGYKVLGNCSGPLYTRKDDPESTNAHSPEQNENKSNLQNSERIQSRGEGLDKNDEETTEGIKSVQDLQKLKECKTDSDKPEDSEGYQNIRDLQDCQRSLATSDPKDFPLTSLSSCTDSEVSADVTLNAIRDSFEKKLLRNASMNSMTTHFGSMKRNTSNPVRDGSFKLSFQQDSSRPNTSGSVKRRAFKKGRPILERHPSALWDARLPESLKQAIEEEKRRPMRAESIELSLLDKYSGQEADEKSSAQRTSSKKDKSKRLGSFKAVDVANPIKFIHERKKLLMASNVRYMSETRDVGVAVPATAASEKAPLKRFYSVETGHQGSSALHESFLSRRLRQSSAIDSWRSDSSVFASAGDLALASLQNISESINEADDDVFSISSRSSGFKSILRLSSQTVRKGGETKKTSVPLFDLSLMVNPVFLVFFLSLICMNFGYPNIFVMLPSFCEEVGLDKTTAAFIVSIIGLTDLVGRIFIGWFSDLRLFPRKYGFMASLAAAGLLCTMLPRMKTFHGLVAFSCAFGFCGGCFIALIAVILVDFLGKERLATSFGLASVGMAVGLMAGPAIYGDIRDTAGSWDVAFVVCGLMSLAAATCIFLEPVAQHLLNRPTKPPSQHLRDEML